MVEVNKCKLLFSLQIFFLKSLWTFSMLLLGTLLGSTQDYTANCQGTNEL